jgi:predicted PurR-regulated permease PerM
MSRFQPLEAPRPGDQELRIFRALFLFGLLVALLLMAYQARMVILPFLLAGLLAYVMSPIVTFLELRGLRRSTAVAALYVGVTLAVGALAYWILSLWWEEIPRLRYQWPFYLQQIQAGASQADAFLLKEWDWVAERISLTEKVSSFLQRADNASRVTPSHYLPLLAAFGLNLFLVPFVGFFFLKGGRAGFQMMLDACPGRSVEKFLSLLYKVDDVIGGYLRGVLLEAFLVGSCVGAGLFMLGVEYAGLLAAATMVFNLVPFVGPLAAGTLAVVAAFLQFGISAAVAKVAVLFLAVRLTDDFVFQPMVMHRAVHLHPALVIFSLLAGHELAGVWGLLLAVPTVSVVKESITLLLAWYRSEIGRPFLPASLARAASKPWVV